MTTMNDGYPWNKTRNDFHPDDLAALDRAMDMTLADPFREGQIRQMLSEDGWHETAFFCAYHQQCESLKLCPWQSPPCAAEEPQARQLLERMLTHGLSVYDPTPLASIKAAQTKARKRSSK